MIFNILELGSKIGDFWELMRFTKSGLGWWRKVRFFIFLSQMIDNGCDQVLDHADLNNLKVCALGPPLILSLVRRDVKIETDTDTWTSKCHDIDSIVCF